MKVVIITGASSGIGKALAYEFAKKNYKVILAARNLESLQSIKEDIFKFNQNIDICKTDVSIESDCKNLIDFTINKFGKIDILVNNAGISMRAIFEELDLSVIKTVMDINFWGTVYCTKFALPYLLQNKGSVIGISSIAGFKGLPGRTGYSASKFAMHGFLETLRIENLKKELHVMIACPGFTTSNIRKTALNKSGLQQGESPREESQMMSAEEVAKRIVKGVESRKRTIIMTSQGKLTIFLNKFFPSWVDKLVYKHIAKEPNSPFK